jgi:hypothetical protein
MKQELKDRLKRMEQKEANNPPPPPKGSKPELKAVGGE